MASPHVAGLLAYFLSIYPSKEFNPAINALESGVSFNQAYDCLTSAYALTRASLPSWVAELLPPVPLVEMLAPIPQPRILSPAQLKLALLKLSSRDILIDLPAKTPNLLVFNNATGY
jgi:cerevisin